MDTLLEIRQNYNICVVWINRITYKWSQKASDVKEKKPPFKK